MSYYRTPEHRKLRAELIKKWKPWENSTGPRTEEGKARASRNGFKGGQWREMLELARSVSAALREQRNSLRNLAG